ncbi:VOC family protein [Peribacillus simplex]|uniref:VOC family protein n=2 Tax=Peribacillus TaxID=2675229 RepID=A0AA90PLE9_9BACI|nr:MULTISPECIES: VOC family protein [Peribacillus]MDP1421686.1 VOC family protein [Peribacillus simplex]MDP1454390.1 VOC family protein [Peribacillus frigoritolerans]
MIKGLYEVHLPVQDLKRSIEFYKNLGLQMASEYDDVAFLWIVPNKTWLGLWKTEISKDRDPASFPGNGRHLAFEVDFDDIKKASIWLTERGITLRSHGGLEPLEPIARPHQQNVSVYFDDPDGNALELMCNLPDGSPTEPSKMMYLSQLEKLIQK